MSKPSLHAGTPVLALLILLVAAVRSSGEAPSAAKPATAHDLMPAPAQLTWQPGALVLDRRFAMAWTGVPDPRVERALGRLGTWLQQEMRLPAPPPQKAGGTATLVVAVAAAGAPVQALGEDESYRLIVSAKGAQLSAPNPLGVLRGLETFRQLVQAKEGRYEVPAVIIDDTPRFPWRGLMIDSCRRWQPLEVIKRTLDGMAAVKLNVLHWHLSEDQGFRIESKTFPKLHELGSEGNYYTQDQVREVIAHARDRGIRVLPEFDMPGHTTSYLVAYPELGTASGPYQLARKWGIFDETMDPAKEEVYRFIDTFLGEMAALFPDAYLHIGGDEVTGRAWNASATVQDFMYRNGMRDNHDLQAHFNRRVSEILTKHGKKMVGWDEILHPDLPKSIVVQSWRGVTALSTAAKQGYSGLLSNGYYLDLNQSAAYHYGFDPIPANSDLTEEQRQRVLGGEACMWSEYVSPETIDSRVWPRAGAVAERLWSPADVRDVDDMYRRLEILSRRLEAFGLSHRSNYLVMLKRLAGTGPVEPLKVLADVVEPVRLYRRSQSRAYTTSTPLDRLVDAARPESDAARVFGREVVRWIETGPTDVASLRRSLDVWKNNHAVLEPILTASPLAAEARGLSKDLAAVAVLGHDALDHVSGGRKPSSAWSAEARTLLTEAGKARAELELGIVPHVRKLVLIAENLDTLRALPGPERNPWLEKKLAPPPPSPGH
jgi:hexosaminidase